MIGLFVHHQIYDAYRNARKRLIWFILQKNGPIEIHPRARRVKIFDRQNPSLGGEANPQNLRVGWTSQTS